jgi:uncharacterized membrane protein YkoI
MRKRVALAVGGAVVVAAVAGAGVAVAGGLEPDESGSREYTQQQADRATAAALEATRGGTANSVERDTENGATWEVEVTKTDGSTVDVRLDDAYGVVVIEGDTEDAAGDSGSE